MSQSAKKILSFVVPVFNEEGNVDRLYEALLKVTALLSDRYDFEMVFTDNHSTDNTFEKLEQLAREDSRIRIFRFSRNFGYQRSIYTGYINARGAAAIQLDADLQDPPELILDFVRQWESGYKVVYGVRRTRKEVWWLEGLRKAFYRTIDFLSKDDLPLDAGDFRLVDRQVLDQLKLVEDCNPYLRGTIAAMGFEQLGIPYDRDQRVWGETKFPLRQMFRLALDALLNHSDVPLRIAAYLGCVVSVLTVLGAIVFLVGKLYFKQAWAAGFATTTILILLSMSLNALFLGIIGEYLARIYHQVRRGPITIIERRVNVPEKWDT